MLGVSKHNSTLSNQDDDFVDDDPIQICGISVMFGTYEKSVKEPTQAFFPNFPLFLVTDQDNLLHPNGTAANNTAWTRVRVDSSLWQEDCLRPQFVGAKNNPCDSPFVFNIAKFYKMQFHRVPEVQEAGCNVVIWFDATIRIHGGTFPGHMAHRADRGQNFVVYVQEQHANGTLAREAQESRYGKYGGKQDAAFGPPQHVWEQYQYYLSKGFREGWFRNESWYERFMGVERNDAKYGVFITCMVMFDLRKRITKRFLDCWWTENVLRSTQDQISFPYCAWKLGIPIHALPDKENSEGSAIHNAYFHKMDHGM